MAMDIVLFNTILNLGDEKKKKRTHPKQKGRVRFTRGSTQIPIKQHGYLMAPWL
nr:hypothetical protein [Fictibacillus enclensis]